MRTVVFENEGIIDPLAITTFGVSAKDNENPIGYFGTGLKYAIAILLREGHTIEIFAGDSLYSFQKAQFEMRGKKFDGVTMNGQMLPFTLELGKNWETWQAFRELYCNALDEGGSAYATSSVHDPMDHFTMNAFFAKAEGKTLVVVRGEGIAEAFKNRDDVILNIDRRLMLPNYGGVEMYDKPSKYVYYRGVRVLELTHKSMFTFNIVEDLILTEDRTVKNSWEVDSMMARAVSSCTDGPAIYRAITANDDYHESSMSFSQLSYYETQGSAEFYELVAREFEANNDKLNRSARDVYTKRIRQAVPKAYVKEDLTPVETIQLDRATAICVRVWPDFKDYKIMVVKTLGQETMALADEFERAIVLSKSTFAMGTKFLVSTMIEEYMHLKTGYKDHSRALQTHLFDQLVSMIENHVICEPV